MLARFFRDKILDVWGPKSKVIRMLLAVLGPEEWREIVQCQMETQHKCIPHTHLCRCSRMLYW